MERNPMRILHIDLGMPHLRVFSVGLLVLGGALAIIRFQTTSALTTPSATTSVTASTVDLKAGMAATASPVRARPASTAASPTKQTTMQVAPSIRVESVDLRTASGIASLPLATSRAAVEEVDHNASAAA